MYIVHCQLFNVAMLTYYFTQIYAIILGVYIDCPVCSKPMYKKNLARHIAVKHTDQAPSQCNLCLKTMKNGWSLKEHERKYHGIFQSTKDISIVWIFTGSFANIQLLQWIRAMCFVSQFVKLLTLKFTVRDQLNASPIKIINFLDKCFS